MYTFLNGHFVLPKALIIQLHVLTKYTSSIIDFLVTIDTQTILWKSRRTPSRDWEILMTPCVWLQTKIVSRINEYFIKRLLFYLREGTPIYLRCVLVYVAVRSSSTRPVAYQIAYFILSRTPNSHSLADYRVRHDL